MEFYKKYKYYKKKYKTFKKLRGGATFRFDPNPATTAFRFEPNLAGVGDINRFGRAVDTPNFALSPRQPVWSFMDTPSSDNRDGPHTHNPDYLIDGYGYQNTVFYSTHKKKDFDWINNRFQQINQNLPNQYLKAFLDLGIDTRGQTEPDRLFRLIGNIFWSTDSFITDSGFHSVESFRNSLPSDWKRNCTKNWGYSDLSDYGRDKGFGNAVTNSVGRLYQYLKYSNGSVTIHQGKYFDSDQGRDIDAQFIIPDRSVNTDCGDDWKERDCQTENAPCRKYLNNEQNLDLTEIFVLGLYTSGGIFKLLNYIGYNASNKPGHNIDNFDEMAPSHRGHGYLYEFMKQLISAHKKLVPVGDIQRNKRLFDMRLPIWIPSIENGEPYLYHTITDAGTLDCNRLTDRAQGDLYEQLLQIKQRWIQGDQNNYLFFKQFVLSTSSNFKFALNWSQDWDHPVKESIIFRIIPANNSNYRYINNEYSICEPTCQEYITLPIYRPSYYKVLAFSQIDNSKNIRQCHPRQSSASDLFECGGREGVHKFMLMIDLQEIIAGQGLPNNCQQIYSP